MQRIKKGDLVQVLSGRDKGRQGKVTQMRSGDRCIVEGIAMVKKHQKPNPEAGRTGGVVPMESAIHLCKVGLVDPSDNKPSRVGFRVEGEGEDRRKVRYFVKSGQSVQETES